MDPIHGLVQDCSNSIANAMELLQSCTKLSPSSLLSVWAQLTGYTTASRLCPSGIIHIDPAWLYLVMLHCTHIIQGDVTCTWGPVPVTSHSQAIFPSWEYCWDQCILYNMYPHKIIPRKSLEIHKDITIQCGFFPVLLIYGNEDIRVGKPTLECCIFR